MPLHHRENQYRGVNAHLHSYFQRLGGWRNFHNDHIADLRRALQEAIPIESGYAVVAEESLQIARYDREDDSERRSRLTPDISILKRGSTQPLRDTGLAAAEPTTILPLPSFIGDMENVLSIVIRELRADRQLGQPITRLELLSPANQPGGSYHTLYTQKRHETLLSGVHLVEIDLLHERPTPLDLVPDYTKGEAGSYPYAILVSRLKDVATAVYGFRVDDPLPNIELPLAGDDTIVFAFDPPYQQTFMGNNLYGFAYVDYERDPEGLDTYSADDQARIRQVMARAAKETS